MGIRSTGTSLTQNRTHACHSGLAPARNSVLSGISVHMGRAASCTCLLILISALLVPLSFGAAAPTDLAAAVATAPCGIFTVPAGTYEIDSPIIKPRCVLMKGDGMGTQIVFEGAGPAVIVGDTGSPTEYPTGGVEDLTLIGPGAGTQTVGVWLGGDPDGGGIGPLGFGDSQTLEDLRIESFGVGIEWGSNAWVDTVARCDIFGNGVGIGAAQGAANSGEENRVEDSDIFNNSGPAVQSASAAAIVFSRTSFDYNSGPAIVSTDTLCFGCHFEGNVVPLIDDSQGGSIEVFGGSALVNPSGSPSAALFVVGQNSTDVAIYDLFVWAGGQVGSLIAGDPSGPAVLVGIAGNGNGDIGQLAASNVGPVYASEDQAFGTAASGLSSTALSTGSLSIASESSVPFDLAAGPSGLTISTSGSDVLTLGTDGTGSTALWLAGSNEALRTTDQTGRGQLVMSQAPQIAVARLFLPSIGGGQALSRMIFSRNAVAVPRLRPSSCTIIQLEAPGTEPGDVAFASPEWVPGSLGERQPFLTWSAMVETEGTITIVVCNPTARTDAPSDYTWNAWSVGAYSNYDAARSLRSGQSTQPTNAAGVYRRKGSPSAISLDYSRTCGMKLKAGSKKWCAPRRGDPKPKSW